MLVVGVPAADARSSFQHGDRACSIDAKAALDSPLGTDSHMRRRSTLCALCAAHLGAAPLILAAAHVAGAQGFTDRYGYQFTKIEPPSAEEVAAYGINDRGQISGSFIESTGGPSRGTFRGFLYDAGSYTTITAPGAQITDVAGISSRGQLVGYAYPSAGTAFGFTYDAGAFTPFAVPGPTRGINARGDVVGASYVSGYVYSGGVSTPFTLPGVDAPDPYGINDAGTIVGTFDDAAGTHGFVYAGGAVTTVDVPGALDTHVLGISASGAISGWYLDAGVGTRGFVYADGAFRRVDVPGAYLTRVWGINDAGAIVGQYFDLAGPPHAFVGVPFVTPEPATWTLVAIGLAGIVGGRRIPARRRR